MGPGANICSQVFHVKRLSARNGARCYHDPVNRSRALLLGLILLSLPVFAACVNVTSPDGWAAPVFDGDDVYIASSKGHLSALTIDEQGRAAARWTFPDKDRDADKKIEPEALYGDPVVEGERVYLATFSAGVFALNTADGRPAWPTSGTNSGAIDGNIASGVALANGILYFGTTEGQLYAWNASDGSPAWPAPITFGRGIWATPVVLGERVYVATMGGEVHARSAVDGSPAWDAPFVATGAIGSLTALGEDRLFVPSINRHAYILDAGSGAVIADYRAKDWVWTAPAGSDSRMYFGDFGGHVYGLDITSQGATQAWDPASVDGERIKAGAAVVDDVLVVADRKPVVTFIKASTGEVLNRVPIDGAGTIRANVTVEGDSVYIVTTKGRLFRANPKNYSVVEIEVSGVKK